MNRSYADWLNIAAGHKDNLDQAIADRNSKDVIYYRGKYLFALKQAYKLDNTGKTIRTYIENMIRDNKEKMIIYYNNIVLVEKRKAP